MLKKIRHSGAVWTVCAEETGAVSESLIGRLTSAAPQPGTTVIRENLIRASFLVKTDSRDCPELFVKRYKTGGLSDALKYLLLPSKARTEWRALNLFEARGLPCPKAIAFSEKKTAGVLRDAFLVTRSLAPAPALNEYVERTPPAPETRREITCALARLVQKLHARGVYYRDLHAGNILIRHRSGSAPDLFFIDLHRAKFPPALFQWMQVRDIAQLCNSLPATAADSARFFLAYTQAAGMSGRRSRAFRKLIQAKRAELEARRIRSRSKRCLRNSTVFEKKASWRETYFGRRDFGRAAAENAIALHAVQRETDLERAVKQTSKSVLTRHVIEGHIPFCVKGYQYLGPLYAVKSLFRKSRAVKSWTAAHGLLVRGIDTPLPLAVVEKKWGPFILESFLVTRWLTGVLELNEYLQHTPLQGRKHAFIKALALAMRAVHDKGIYHGDLKSNNILVEDLGPEGWRFYFIDLDRVSFTRRVLFQERANNLAQSNASVTGSISAKARLLFFRFYAKGTSSFDERKQYYRKILAISRTKNTAPYGVMFAKPCPDRKHS